MKTLYLIAAMAAASAAFASPTKALFFFDTEEYTDPKSSDAIVSIANLLSEEGVRGQFAFVGYLAKRLVDWRRTDVMDALKPHLIGMQTLYHSFHPNINEKTDMRRFLPSSIEVDGVWIGPADFLFAALTVLETGDGEVKVTPREQLGDVAALMPGLNGFTTRGTWRYMPSYEDRYLSDRLRFQLWTLRYE